MTNEVHPQHLEEWRDRLGVSVLGMCSLLDVSRTAYYQWLAKANPMVVVNRDTHRRVTKRLELLDQMADRGEIPPHVKGMLDSERVRQLLALMGVTA